MIKFIKNPGFYRYEPVLRIKTQRVNGVVVVTSVIKTYERVRI